MAEVTDGDREKAADVLAAILEDDDTQFSSLTLIAMAIAAEREKARAPFLALAEEYDQEDPRISRSVMAIFRASARDLRRAAGVTE